MTSETKTLSHPILGTRVFPVQQAENIMKIPVANRGGWVEVLDEKVQLTEENGTTNWRDSRDIGEESTEESNDREGD